MRHKAKPTKTTRPRPVPVREIPEPRETPIYDKNGNQIGTLRDPWENWADR